MLPGLPVFRLLAILLVIGGIPWAYARWQKSAHRNFRIVEPGLLYRSGRFSTDDLNRVVQMYGIRTVINFRAEESGEQPDQDEEEFCCEHFLDYYRVVYLNWEDRDGGPPPADQSVSEFLALMDRRHDLGPILIHCFAGRHRTGAFTAIYRMQYNGWSNDEAIREMIDAGYDGFHRENDIRTYLTNYDPRLRRSVVGNPR